MLCKTAIFRVAMQKNTTLKEFAKYVSSSIISMIGLSCYILADTFFISLGMGETGLAALNISCPAFSVVFSLGMLFGVGGATKFAIHRGAKEKDKANQVFTHTVLVVGIFAVVFILLGAFLSEQISYALGADQETIAYCNDYVKIILCFAPFFMFNTVFQNFIRNDGSPRLAMTAMLLGNLFNIVFDWVFVFPCKLNMLGAALATGISPIISICILSLFFIKKKNSFRLTKCKISMQTILGLSALGVPSFLSELSTGIVMIIFNKLLYDLGQNTAVAAYGIIVNVAYVVNAIINGVAQGAQPLVSYNYGDGNYQKMRMVLKYALVTMSALAIIMYVVVCAGADGITKIFNSEQNADLQNIAPFGLRIYFIYALFADFNILFAGYFSASNKALYSQIITLTRCYVTIIPLAYLFAHLFGMTGLWLSMTVAEIITLAVTISLFAKSQRVKLHSQPEYVRE